MADKLIVTGIAFPSVSHFLLPQITRESIVLIAPENTRFEYNEGTVTFIIQDLDGYDPEDITNSMSIKVCVTI